MYVPASNRSLVGFLMSLFSFLDSTALARRGATYVHVCADVRTYVDIWVICYVRMYVYVSVRGRVGRGRREGGREGGSE